MNKTVIIVSTHVDVIIKEQQPDVKFILFRNLQELSAYVENTPIRANTLYITRETLLPAVNTSLNFLMTMLDNPFLAVDKVEYITEVDSVEINSIQYVIEDLGITNWRITKGALTREFVTGIISGTLQSDEITPMRKAVYRQRKDVYIKDKLKNKESLEESYLSEEDILSDIEDEEVTPIVPMQVEEVCKTVTIAGLDLEERTVFSFIMAQYLSFSGKTIIIEKDFEYLRLSDIASKSNTVYVKIDVEELFQNTEEVFRFIRNTNNKLIVLTCSQRSDHDYQFLCNFIYNNLVDSLSYLVVESDMKELNLYSQYVTVLPNNIIDVIKTIEQVPDNFENNAKFVGISMKNINELKILDSDALTVIVKDLLQVSYDFEVPVLNISSLKLGGAAHDLRMFIGSR